MPTPTAKPERPLTAATRLLNREMKAAQVTTGWRLEFIGSILACHNKADVRVSEAWAVKRWCERSCADWIDSSRSGHISAAMGGGTTINWFRK